VKPSRRALPPDLLSAGAVEPSPCLRRASRTVSALSLTHAMIPRPLSIAGVGGRPHAGQILCPQAGVLVVHREVLQTAVTVPAAGRGPLVCQHALVLHGGVQPGAYARQESFWLLLGLVTPSRPARTDLARSPVCDDTTCRSKPGGNRKAVISNHVWLCDSLRHAGGDGADGDGAGVQALRCVVVELLHAVPGRGAAVGGHGDGRPHHAGAWHGRCRLDAHLQSQGAWGRRQLSGRLGPSAALPMPVRVCVVRFGVPPLHSAGDSPGEQRHRVSPPL